MSDSQRSQTSTAQSAADKPLLKSARVVLIEKDAELRRMLGQDLKQIVSFRSFASIDETLASIQTQPADILIISLNLPHQRTMRLLQEQEHSKHPARRVLMGDPVVFEKQREQLLKWDIDACLALPIGRNQLKECVEKLWRIVRALDEQERIKVQTTATLAGLRAKRHGISPAIRQDTDTLIDLNRELQQQLEVAIAQWRSCSQSIELINLQATVDPLTGIYNRREFVQRFALEWSRYKRYGRPVSLILLDIDLFKSVNDTYGHEAGDLVLKSLAGFLRSGMRRQDLVSRYGGEEFIILLPETRLVNAYQVAETLRGQVERHVIQFQDTKLQINISLGVSAALEQTPKDEAEMLRLADMAMYRAKKDGRNRVVVLDPKDHSRIIQIADQSVSMGNVPLSQISRHTHKLS